MLWLKSQKPALSGLNNKNSQGFTELIVRKWVGNQGRCVTCSYLSPSQLCFAPCTAVVSRRLWAPRAEMWRSGGGERREKEREREGKVGFP